MVFLKINHRCEPNYWRINYSKFYNHGKKVEKDTKVLSPPYDLVFYVFRSPTLHLSLVEKFMHVIINLFLLFIEEFSWVNPPMTPPQKCVDISSTPSVNPLLQIVPDIHLFDLIELDFDFIRCGTLLPR